ncbi:MAG: hypothetical protein E7Z85_00265 [Methanosphaera stadtmanae]|nr:hypothetical protein [Methanosphaera stadtmanae]
MSKINEILTSIVLYSIISYILNLPNFEYGLLLAILGSQVNILLPKNYKHSLIFFIPLYVLSLLYPALIIPMVVGYSSSILIGLLSKNACKLLYPIRETTFSGPKNYLENDSKRDYAATAFLITLVVISLLLSFNGMEILDDLDEENNFNDYFNNHEIQHNGTAEAVQYVNINPSYCVNKNITTIISGNTTTTLITEYKA